MRRSQYCKSFFFQFKQFHNVTRKKRRFTSHAIALNSLWIYIENIFSYYEMHNPRFLALGLNYEPFPQTAHIYDWAPNTCISFATQWVLHSQHQTKYTKCCWMNKQINLKLSYNRARAIDDVCQINKQAVLLVFINCLNTMYTCVLLTRIFSTVGENRLLGK